MREIRRVEKVERIREEKRKEKGYLSIKPSKNFDMTREELEAFWLSEMAKAREEMEA